MNEVHHRQLAGKILDRRRADDEGVAEARRNLRLREPLVVGAQVEEVQRVGRAEISRFLGEAAPVGQLLDPLPRSHGEVVPALSADPQVRDQLVVAVMRAAVGAGVPDASSPAARACLCSIETSIPDVSDIVRS